MAPELVEEFVLGFHAELNRAHSERGAERAAAARKLEQINRQNDALVSAIAEGIKSTSVAAKLSALEAECEGHAALLNREPEQPARMHPNLASLYRKKVAAPRDALTNEERRTEALGILALLIEGVLIHPIEGGYEIELPGEIANIVELTAGSSNKKAARFGAALNAVERYSVLIWLRGPETTESASTILFLAAPLPDIGYRSAIRHSGVRQRIAPLTQVSKKSCSFFRSIA